MNGTLRPKPGRSNYWEMRVEAGADPVTRRRRQISRGFRGTKKEAERALRQFAAEADAGRHRGTDQTVAMLLEVWVGNAGPSRSPRRLPSEIARYRSPRRAGARRQELCKLRARDLDRLHDKMMAAGSAGGTV